MLQFVGAAKNRSASVVGAAAVGTVVLVLGAVQPATAKPDAIGCGSVITSSVTVTADLTSCAGDGLVVGASGITVDLGGHTISGRQFGAGGDPNQVGIDDSGGFDAVTIRNGTVREFVRGGVHLTGADRSTIDGLSVAYGGEFGIRVDGGSGNRVAGNTVENAGIVGIGLFGTAVPARGDVITGNTVVDASTADIAVRYGTFLDTRIENNTLTQLDNVDRWGAPIAVSARYTTGEGRFRNTVVRGNHVNRSYAGGVYLGDTAQDSVVAGNDLDNIPGLSSIETDGVRTRIQSNTVRSTEFPGSTGFGVVVDADAADTRVALNSLRDVGNVSLDDSGARTVFTGNVIIGADPAAGLPTGFVSGVFVRAEARDAVVQGNLVRRQAPLSGSTAAVTVSGARTRLLANVVSEIQYGDGIWVQPAATGTTVQTNLVTTSSANGLRVEDASATVGGNVALRNAQLGILAVDGVTDGGGNVAAGNGDPRQCVGVRCRTG